MSFKSKKVIPIPNKNEQQEIKIVNEIKRSSFEINIETLNKIFPDKIEIIPSVLQLVLNNYDDASEYLKNLVNSENSDSIPLSIDEMIFID